MNGKIRKWMLLLLVSVLCITTGCAQRNKIKVVELDEKEESKEQTLSIDTKKIYRYDYNYYSANYNTNSTYQSMVWDRQKDNNIIIPEYNVNTGIISVRNVDYRYGFFDELISFDKNLNRFLKSISDDGKYMLVEEQTDEERIFFIYDVEQRVYTEIERVSKEKFPTILFDLECSWIPETDSVVYAWNYTWFFADGETELIDLQEYRDGRLRFPDAYYTVYYYDCLKQTKSDTILMENWRKRNALFEFKIKRGSQGTFILYTINDSRRLCKNNIAVFSFDDKGMATMQYPEINEHNYTEFWIGNQEIYAQSVVGGLYRYNYLEESPKWELVIDDKKSKIIDLVVSQDGEKLYVAEANEVFGDMVENLMDRYYTEKNNLYVYSLEYKKKEYIYKRANNIVNIQLSPEEDKLAMEVGESFITEDVGFTMVQRLFVFSF